MPMALTDHIDRNPEKRLLRGKIGHVHSWVVQPDEPTDFHNGVRILGKLPKAVFLKFEGVDWTLPGLTEKGLYPISPKKASWFLDKNRKHPVLRISRQQIPLAPAFAITSHAAQGQTLAAAIVDLQIGRGTSPISSYVAITRVKTRSDLLIYRAFDRHLFTNGGPEGPELLLKTLRGEYVDWKAIEDKHTPSAMCCLCGFLRFKQDFAPSQWRRQDQYRGCRQCVEKKSEAGTPYECMMCHFWKSADAFRNDDLKCWVHRICMDCNEKRVCLACGMPKAMDEFTAAEWVEAAKTRKRGKCKNCMRHGQTVKLCSKCNQRKDESQFAPDQFKRSANIRRCLECQRHRSSPSLWKCNVCKTSQLQSNFSQWLSARKNKTKVNGAQRCNNCTDKRHHS